MKENLWNMETQTQITIDDQWVPALRWQGIWIPVYCPYYINRPIVADFDTTNPILPALGLEWDVYQMVEADTIRA